MRVVLASIDRAAPRRTVEIVRFKLLIIHAHTPAGSEAAGQLLSHTKKTFCCFESTVVRGTHRYDAQINGVGSQRLRDNTAAAAVVVTRPRKGRLLHMHTYTQKRPRPVVLVHPMPHHNLSPYLAVLAAHKQRKLRFLLLLYHCTVTRYNAAWYTACRGGTHSSLKTRDMRYCRLWGFIR